jgi:hypothetical protein
MGAIPSLLLAVSTCFGGGFEELAVGEEVWGLAAGFLTGAGRSPPAAGLPAAGQKKAAATGVLRSSGEGEKMKGVRVFRVHLPYIHQRNWSDSQPLI